MTLDVHECRRGDTLTDERCVFWRVSVISRITACWPVCRISLPIPLYITVAHYVLLANALVSRQAISVVFRISMRCAFEVMLYLPIAKVDVMYTPESA